MAAAVLTTPVPQHVYAAAAATATATATPPPTPQAAYSAAPPSSLLFGSSSSAVTGNNLSLYVGDLDPSVEEGQLYDLFNQVAQVASIRVCRDAFRRTSLGYAYVNFNNPQDATKAREVLNFTLLNGKPIRIMFCQRDPNSRKSGSANIFIKNLDSTIDNKALYDTFVLFGNILSCKVAVDSSGQSKGYGYVQYEKEEAARMAIEKLNGMLINDKKVYVGVFVRSEQRRPGNAKFNNVYVKNFSTSITEEDLRKTFGKYGTITSAVVMKDATGVSKCFGFVNFQNPDEAATAVEQVNGKSLENDDKTVYVGKAQRKAERDAELKTRFERERNSRFEKLQGANLYLKNLSDNITDEKLRELFSEFGTITSSKVMVNQRGLSKGSGFVAFSSPEEAARALNMMNGKIIDGKPLYVAVAQRKEERRALLLAQFAHLGLASGMPPLATGIHGYHPGAPRLAPPPMYYGQGAPGMLPHQAAAAAGYGFQPQLLPAGMRPGVAPNYVMPYQFQRPVQGGGQQRAGGRRGGNFQHSQHQQFMHRSNQNQGSRYLSAARNGMGYDASGAAAAVAPLPISTLSSALASASPEDQRVMLGEQLYPLVEKVEEQHAKKVTGMLLEMDQTEVLHLIEAPDALKKKVAEAIEVLQSAANVGAA